MAPLDNPYVATQLRHLIYYFLDNDMLQNAAFYSALLHGMDTRNSEAVHLLSLCQVRLGQHWSAYEYSKEKGSKGQHLGCAYVHAQACLILEKFKEGIAALERVKGMWAVRNHWNKHSESTRRHIPDAAAVHCLLGKLWMAHKDVKRAGEHFAEALKLNPFMWDAFSQLSEAGVSLRVASIFKPTSEMIASSTMDKNGQTPFDIFQPNLPLQPHVNGSHNIQAMPVVQDPFNPAQRTVRGNGNLFHNFGNGGLSKGVDRDYRMGNGPHFDDEDAVMEDVSSYPSYDPDAAPSQLRKPRSVQSVQSEPTMDIPKLRGITTRSKAKAGSESCEPSESLRAPTASTAQKRIVSGHSTQNGERQGNMEPPGAPRRSVRLFLNRETRPSATKLSVLSSKDSESKDKRDFRKTKLPNVKGKAVPQVGRVVSGNRKPDPADRASKERPASAASMVSARETAKRALVHAQPAEPPLEQEAIKFLMDLCEKLAAGYYLECQYHCPMALEYFESVPQSIKETSWVLAQKAKLLFERGHYAESERVFAKVRRMAPSRMEDMEVYSTVLWHLKKEIELAYLSHELIEMDRLSPQAWCAIGNSFSLQREHDQAIKCFKRATQLDPKFAYAYTLQGHEHVANEEFEPAIFAYRKAVATDKRHYNGWYGLGQCFEKLGKYGSAEEHYKVAISINPSNPVLAVCIGVIFEKTKRIEQAHECYSKACEVDPKSNKARSMKARTLLKMGRLEDAAAELDILKDQWPDDPNAHFMLGRLLKALGNKNGALKHYTIALNLDPKATAHIKESLEALENPDDDEDMEDGDF